MLPIFFHLESHLWIAYLFFANGFLLQLFLRSVFSEYRTLTASLEAQLLGAFFISISLNALLILALDIIGGNFSALLPVLLLFSVGLLLCLILARAKYDIAKSLTCEWSGWRVCIYAITFILLFYNGGLIEQITDAWWHMSLASKIALASSFDTELGHLTASATRDYPHLWHGNLALAHSVSGISLPVLWNSFTAWGAVIKLMAFYLFSFGLTRDKSIATIAVLLFLLLPGIGNSYLRVSAWPSHISYAAWFTTFFVACDLFQTKSKTAVANMRDWFSLVSATLMQKATAIAAIACLATVIFFTHRVELLWLAIAWFAYWITCSIRVFLLGNRRTMELHGGRFSAISYRVVLLALLGYSLWFFVNKLSAGLKIDHALAYGFPVLVLLVLVSIEFLKQRARSLNCLLLIMCASLILISINYTHLYSLFVPEFALPQGFTHERPVIAVGLFGTNLVLPGWHLQLREGLLYSGILSLPLSALLLFIQPSRAALFVFSCGLVALLFCVSPYLYQWLQDILSYHSPWRIAILVFHPLLFAQLMSVCLGVWRQR